MPRDANRGQGQGKDQGEDQGGSVGRSGGLQQLREAAARKRPGKGLKKPSG